MAGNARILGGTVDMGAYESPAGGLAAAPVVQPACGSTASGAITPALVGACLPLTVAWQSGGQSGATLDSLAAGAYVVTLTDAQGRNVAFSAQVPVANAPMLQVDGTPISCFGADDATLSATPLTGQPPFAYSWSPPVTTDSLATGLPPGPISVTVTDAWGCTSAFSFQVPEPDTLQFTAVVQDATGQQSANGSIQVTGVTGGTLPYHYLWSPGGSMGAMVSNLLPGLYTLTVTDHRGCAAAWTFEVGYVSGTEAALGPAVLSIYPNPAAETVMVAGDFQDRAPAVLELYAAGGRLVRSWTCPDGGTASGPWSLSLEGLASGAYLAQLKDAQGRLVGTGRLVKE